MESNQYQTNMLNQTPTNSISTNESKNEHDIQNILALIHVVSNLVSSTPSKVITQVSGKERLIKILEILQNINAEHFHFFGPAHERIYPQIGMNHVRYLPVISTPKFEIGVFVFPPSTYLPLHNHPNMCVVSKLLYGNLHLRSFNILQTTNSSISNIPGAVFGECSRDEWVTAPFMTTLFHNHNNIHSLETDETGCAVLDIVFPPYNEHDGRECTYYAENRQFNLTFLVPINVKFHAVNGYFVPEIGIL